MSHHPKSLHAKLQALVDGAALQGKVYFITGGSRGLGRGVAARALSLGARVYVTGRTVSDAMEAEIIEEARALSPSRMSATPRVSALQLDLGSLDDVAYAVRTLRAAGVSIDVLVLNAGLYPSRAAVTRQGFELSIGVNCVGHHVLTQGMLAAGLLRPAARMVVITSETHRVAEPLNVRAVCGTTAAPPLLPVPQASTTTHTSMRRHASHAKARNDAY